MTEEVKDVLAIALVIAGLVVLFHGDPDIADALRAVALKWAGLKP